MLPECASKVPSWGTFGETQGHNIATVCLQDDSLGQSWEAQHHDIARVCL